MKLRKSFDTLPQRIFYNYLLCFSPFRPIESDEADRRSQEQMHSLCEDILRSLYEYPSLMNIKVEPDDCFELYVSNNRKPELSKSLRKAGEQMGNLYRILCHAALNGKINGNKLAECCKWDINSLINMTGVRKDRLSCTVLTMK